MDLDFLYFYDQLLQRFACEGLSTRSYCFLQESLKSFGQSNTRQNYRNCTCCGKLRPRRFQCQRRTNMYVKAKLYIDLDAGGRWGIKSRGSIPIKKVSYCHSVSLPWWSIILVKARAMAGSSHCATLLILSSTLFNSTVRLSSLFSHFL